MSVLSVVGSSLPRKDGMDKVHGRTRFTDDLHPPGLLHAALLISPHSHAAIASIDTSEAARAPGVRAVVTGADFPILLGLYLGDKTPLACGKVRHFGEPVAAVIADTPHQAEAAAGLIRASFTPLPIVHGIKEALAHGAPIIHEQMDGYAHILAIHPEPGSNVANRTKIRKGNVESGFAGAEVIVEQEFSFPPGDHVAMEPRAAIAEILADGTVVIRSSTQAPFVVRSLMSIFFKIPVGKIVVVAPLIGGGFGGKAGIQLEGLAYLLSKSVGGKPVRVANSREQESFPPRGTLAWRPKSSSAPRETASWSRWICSTSLTPAPTPTTPSTSAGRGPSPAPGRIGRPTSARIRSASIQITRSLLPTAALAMRSSSPLNGPWTSWRQSSAWTRWNFAS
jgi:CO/xanthine dehydrogenase Mo-binding subunit